MSKPVHTHGKRGPAPQASRRERGRGTFKALLLATVYICLVVLGITIGHWMTGHLEIDIHHSPETDAWWHRVVLITFFTYVVLMTLPFVPGVEVGLALLVIFGGEMALLVYLGTVFALICSFVMGRVVPERAVLWTLAFLHLRRAHEFVSRLQSLPAQERLRFLLEASPARSLTWLLRFRLVAIAILLNLPGNALIGGGGGIGMAAGMSRLFSFPSYLLTVCIATAPVPLLVALTDPTGG